MRAATCADMVLNACARLPISSCRCVGSSWCRSPWAIAVAAAASRRSGLLMVWATTRPMTTASRSAIRNAPTVIALISSSAAANASRRTDTLSCATVSPGLVAQRDQLARVVALGEDLAGRGRGRLPRPGDGLLADGLVAAERPPSVYTASRPWPPVNRLTLWRTASVTAWPKTTTPAGRDGYVCAMTGAAASTYRRPSRPARSTPVSPRRAACTSSLGQSGVVTSSPPLATSLPSASNTVTTLVSPLVGTQSVTLSSIQPASPVAHGGVEVVPHRVVVDVDALLEHALAQDLAGRPSACAAICCCSTSCSALAVRE